MSVIDSTMELATAVYCLLFDECRHIYYIQCEILITVSMYETSDIVILLLL